MEGPGAPAVATLMGLTFVKVLRLVGVVSIKKRPLQVNAGHVRWPAFLWLIVTLTSVNMPAFVLPAF